MIRVIIADDEAPARARIRRLLESREDCEIVAECPDGPATLDALLRESVDLVFLDIQMPGLTGFEVLAALPDSVKRPAVVFATAFDEHAIKAFEVAAVDYLLKPFNPARFHSALERAIESARTRPSGANDDDLRALLHKASRQSDFRIPVRDGDNLFFVRARDIDYIRSAGNYLVIHAGEKSYIHRETLTSMETRVVPLGFFRLNRSILVNLSRVRETRMPPGGPNQVVLDDDTTLPLTRPLRDLKQALTHIDQS